jgi:hypothetical protein
MSKYVKMTLCGRGDVKKWKGGEKSKGKWK